MQVFMTSWLHFYLISAQINALVGTATVQIILILSGVYQNAIHHVLMVFALDPAYVFVTKGMLKIVP